MRLFDVLPSTIGAAACIPALLLLWLVVVADRRPEPPLRVLAALLGGIVAGLFVLHTHGLYDALIAPLLQGGGLARHVLLGVAVPEETVKVLFICLFVFNRRTCEEPMDGIVNGAAVGLGFAAYENLNYLANVAEHWRATALLRNGLTVPFHGALGVIAGGYLSRLYFGKAIGAPRRSLHSKIAIAAFAWLVPVLLHTAFDTTLYSLPQGGDDPAYVYGLLTLAAFIGGGTIAIAIWLIRKLARHQRALGTRVPMRDWRAVWAVVVVGCICGFCGTALFAGAVIDGIVDEYQAATAGSVLLVAAIAIFHWSGRNLLSTLPPGRDAGAA